MFALESVLRKSNNQMQIILVRQSAGSRNFTMSLRLLLRKLYGNCVYPLSLLCYDCLVKLPQEKIIFATMCIHHRGVVYLMLRALILLQLIQNVYGKDLGLHCLCCSTTAVLYWRYCSFSSFCTFYDYTVIIEVLCWTGTFLAILIFSKINYDPTSCL